MDSSTSTCLNCSNAIPARQAYCGHCGQRSDTHRLTLHDLGHAVVHVFTHADRSVLALARDLAFKPGRVARDYVDGKRRKYFSPFTFVLVVVGVASLVLAASKFVDFLGMAPANPVSAFLQRNINLVILVQLPLLSLFAMALFRKEKLHFTEHLVLASYTSGFRSIFFTVFIAPVWMLFHWNHGATVAAYLAAWLIYFGIACAQFYNGNRWWLWFKGVLVGVLAQVTVTVLISAAIWSWFKFFR